jgi:peptidoglycan/LPS O-acetylase OafA/YrhL
MGFNHLGMVNSSAFKDGHIPSLNGWRAVAISLVMLDHARFTMGFPQDRIPNWSRIFFEQGNLGVRIFFVLSGFLITHLLLREAERLGSFSRRGFYIRRCLRILPVYFVYLGILAGLIALNVYGHEEASSWLGALTFTRNMVGPVSSYTGHFWSLAVEEQFYLIWPLSLAAFSLWRRPHLAYGLLLIPIVICPLMRIGSLIPENHGELYNRVFGGNSILVYADSLAMGCLGAFGIRHISLQRTLATTSLVLMLALVVIGFGAYKCNVGGG